MGLGVTTRTVQNVIDRVTRQFGDTAGVQLVTTDIIMFINAGQIEITKNNQTLKSVSVAYSVAGTEIYSFPSVNIMSIEALYYKGNPIKVSSFNEFQELVLGDPSYNDPTQSGTPTMWWEWGTELHLYPIPDTTGDEIRIYYTTHPTDVTSASDTLSVPDVLFEPLVDFVLTKAYEMDENLTYADYKSKSWKETVSQGSSREAGQFNGTYPVITVLEDDL